jgi:nicotinic acetylcholine receptor alpha-3
MLTRSLLIRCCTVRLTIATLLGTLVVTSLRTLTITALLRTLAVTTLTLLAITALLRTLAITTLALLAITALLRTLAITTLALLAITALLRTLAVTTLTLLTITTLVVVTGTVSTTLGCIALQTCTKALRTETTLIVMLTIGSTLESWACCCMDTWTRRASLSYLSLKTILLCWFFVFLFVVLKFHSWSFFNCSYS